MNSERYVCTVLVSFFELNKPGCDCSVCAVYVSALDGDGNAVCSWLEAVPFHDIGIIRKTCTCRNNIFYSSSLKSKEQSVIKNLVSPYNFRRRLCNPHACISSRFRRFWRNNRLIPLDNPHVILKVSVLMEIMMINSSASCYRQIRIKETDRFKSEEFFKPIFYHVKPWHSAIKDYGIRSNIFIAKFCRSFCKHIKDWIDNIICIPDAVHVLIIGINKLPAHKRLKNCFYFFLCKIIIIREVASGITTNRIPLFLTIVIIVPIWIEYIRILNVDIFLQIFGPTDELRHETFFLFDKLLLYCYIRILCKKSFVHFFSNGFVKIVSAQKCVPVGGDFINLKGFKVFASPPDFMHGNIKGSSSKVEYHNFFRGRKIQYCIRNFTAVYLIYKIVNCGIRFWQKNCSVSSILILCFDSCQFSSFNCCTAHWTVKIGRNCDNCIRNLPALVDFFCVMQ